MELKRRIRFVAEPGDRPFKRHSPSHSSPPTPSRVSQGRPSIAEQYDYFDNVSDGEALEIQGTMETTATQAADWRMEGDSPPPPYSVEDPANDPVKSSNSSGGDNLSIDPQLLAMEQLATDNPRHTTTTTTTITDLPLRSLEDSIITIDRLANTSPHERADLYEEIWKRQEIPLKDFHIPSLCSKVPELADEILAAYLELVTFTVKVWANYDAVTRKYFISDPRRLEDCGKLYLSPQQRAQLEAFGDKLELRRIRFDIGTPFKTLFYLHVNVVAKQEDRYREYDGEDSNDSSPSGTIPCLETSFHEVDDVGTSYIVRPHYILRYRVEQVVRSISGRDLDTGTGKNGLTLSDLDSMAREFRFEPRVYGQKQQWFED